MIKIANISKVYKMKSGDLNALSNINLHVKKGEFVAITGTSGSGKSTLMNILGCLSSPSSGTYLLNDKNVFSMTKKQLAHIRNHEIGFIFQKFHLLDKMTARENVELPLMYARIPITVRRRLSSDALSRVGLSDRMLHRPHELSGGQQQRVAIARAITQKPSIILADEPTGNLDPDSRNDILSILSELNSNGSTIVLITHDEIVANYAQRVIKISGGKIIT